MSNATVNFTSEASTNSRYDAFGEIPNMDICICIISILFGLPTHSYIIWLIITGTGVASDFFNLNLSFCEIGICLNSLFTLIYYCTELSHFISLAWFSSGLLITGRPLFQCLICVKCYLAVVHPVTFLKYKPLRYRVICCTVAWIITLGSCLCCMFISQFKTVYIYFHLVQFLLFLCIQLFCLVAVLRALKQSGPGERGRKKEEENHMKRRAFYIILITTVTMSIVYIPNIVSGLSFILMQRTLKQSGPEEQEKGRE
ncbi:G-protein coupled receptor 35-like [Carassius gibelio]|uniref:G-protein coupled receptor 35-like n=1 Tax=Carassius gibelio TaxID=101364 RepID=UPI00227982BF|nr:G-protein coupled receptor 35-like [Carassius gibelio]